MNFSEYNEIIRFWTEEVYKNRQKDAEVTLKYCNDIIDYGLKVCDSKLIGFGYYYSAETYYCLNDGSHFYETVSKALDYLQQAKEWEFVVRCYNYLGIMACTGGNLPFALDYYLNAIKYCQDYDLPEMEAILNINAGALNLQCERYTEAQRCLEQAFSYINEHPECEKYHMYMLGIYENLAKCFIFQGQYDRVEEIQRHVYREHWKYADEIDKMSVLCTEALYYFHTHQFEKLDECIEMIDQGTTENMSIMDIFDDYYEYCKVLLEYNKEKEFWNVIETLETMTKNINILNLHLKIISMKMKFYRKHSQSADYLRAAGLYYEISEMMDKEQKEMMNNVLNLRRSLETVNRQNEILTEKSEQDALTKMPNRFKLNEQAEISFERALMEGTPIAVEILDIDYFKEFNDNYGHQEGDQCLIAVANAIKEMTEGQERFCARYGGDEFILIYEGICFEEAMEKEKELKRKIMSLELEHNYSKALPIVTVSQGMCWDVPVEGSRVWDFLHKADEMLYRVKKHSRNNYCIGHLRDEDEVVIGD